MGLTTAKGLGTAHQRRRRQFAPSVAVGVVDCRRCGQPILIGQAWDLGHDDFDRSKPTYPEHRHAADCPEGGNRATAGRRRRFGSRPW